MTTSPWAEVGDLPPSVVELHPPDAWAGWLGMATDILWAATGRRWRGTAQVESAVLRAAPPGPGESGWLYEPSWGRCTCYGGTGPDGPLWDPRPGLTHAAPHAVRMPRRDVTQIVGVQVDGATLAAWRLDGSWLTRTDGQPWPVCGERAVVTYTYGRTPPAAGRAVCAELAAELGKAGADKPSALPKRLTSVTRQGITFSVIDNLDFLDKGLTGISTVDAWIRSVNPRGRTREASVWSPDLPTARRI